MSELVFDLEAVEFADDGGEPRCPCVLLLDTSGSMRGERVASLNRGLRVFKEHLVADRLASRRVEVAVITFDSEVRIVQDFVTVDRFQPPTLVARGITQMGPALHEALDLVQARMVVYARNAIKPFVPCIFLISDGESHGGFGTVVSEAVDRIREMELNKRLACFTVGVEGANFEKLASISVRPPIRLRGVKFEEMFVWLSWSFTLISHTRVGDKVALPSPHVWGEIG